ncbi:MAG: hypothetical protein H0W48_02085 [Methylibium sp.]|nr:hypothetical protein [Methylibium sp.]MBA3623255.1 hypothetical protein [Methylibium sp.]
MRTSLDAPQGAAATQPTLGWQEMLTHRSYLLRYARSRLQDPSLAEDAVHDVFVAVLCGRARFGGRAAPRSWLVGILRHKIVDLIRTRSGTDSLDVMADDEAADEPVCPCCRPDERAEQRERLAHTLARTRRPAGNAAPCRPAAPGARPGQRRGLPNARHQRGQPACAPSPRTPPVAGLRRGVTVCRPDRGPRDRRHRNPAPSDP